MKYILLIFISINLAYTHPNHVARGKKDKMHTYRVPKETSRATPEQTSDYWFNVGQSQLVDNLAKTYNTGVAKNVILFMGDGMSIPTLTSARIYKGGENYQLAWEKFPFTGLSKTYCVDSTVADSACSGTAYLSGIKTNIAMLGVTASVENKNCQHQNNISNHVYSILRQAQLAGKGSGFVTTTRITHASPANTYAHIADRDWECDADIALDNVDTDTCDDIAEQLIHGETGINLNVMFGGGRAKFRAENMNDEEGDPGERLDGQDLIQQWQDLKSSQGKSWAWAWNRATLEAIDLLNTQHILGIFDKSHMDYHFDNDDSLKPSLPVMVRTAITALQTNPNGFVLFVEGGLIDRAHHDTRARRALDETIQLEEAVMEALLLVNTSETLIIVTSDHAHTFTLGGYPPRGQDILGVAGISDIDDRPYTSLSYANGPGYKEAESDGDRYNVQDDDFDDDKYEYPSLAPLSSETHGGDDVGVFAIGPWAHLLVGNYEENFIPHVINYAACMGNGLKACKNRF